MAIGSPHQLLSPVRTHKDAPSLGAERVPTARLLSPLLFIRAALRPHPPVTCETSWIHQRQQALHLAAAATVWTPWLDLSHTLQNATLITKSPPSLSVKDFLTSSYLRTSSAGEALSSVTLPSRPTLSTCSFCISSCALDSFAAPVGPVAANCMYVIMGLCKPEETGSAAPECAVLIQDERAFKVISRPTPVNTGLISIEGRLQR